MPWQDRDYAHGASGFGGAGGVRLMPFGYSIGPHSFVVWLIVINAAVLLLDAILFRTLGEVDVQGVPLSPLQALGHFSVSTTIAGFQIWRLITFQFLHDGLWHLFFNSLILFFLGPMIESYFGSKRFLSFYLLSGLAGALTYMLLLSVGIVVSSPHTPLIGASAGCFGLLAAGAAIAPKTTIYLFFVIPVQLRVAVWILLFITVYVVVAKGGAPSGWNAGGEAAHLGGAVLGFVLIRNPRWLDWADRIAPVKMKHRRAEGRWQRKQKQVKSDQAEVDRILDKVRDQGLQSLSRKEKKILARATDRQRRAG